MASSQAVRLLRGGAAMTHPRPRRRGRTATGVPVVAPEPASRRAGPAPRPASADGPGSPDASSSASALVVVTLVFVYPFIWLLSASLKPRGEVFDNRLIPETFTFDNYVEVWHEAPDGALAAATRILVTVLAAVTVTISQRDGRLGVRLLPVPGPQPAVRPGAGHDDAARRGDDDPDVPHLELARAMVGTLDPAVGRQPVRHARSTSSCCASSSSACRASCSRRPRSTARTTGRSSGTSRCR